MKQNLKNQKSAGEIVANELQRLAEIGAAFDAAARDRNKQTHEQAWEAYLSGINIEAERDELIYVFNNCKDSESSNILKQLLQFAFLAGAKSPQE